MAVAGGPNIVEDGLVLALDAANIKSYQSGSTAVQDLTGGTAGSLQNGTSFTSSGIKSFDFDGSNDAIEIPHQDKLNSGNNFSVCVWVNPDLFEDPHTSIIQKGVASNATQFRLKFRGLAAGTGEVYSTGDGDYDMRFTIGTGIDRRVIAFGDMNDYVGVWSYMVGTYDGSTQKLYWNGEEKVSYSTTVTVNQVTGSVQLGGYTTFDGNYFNGSIGLAQIYNRALTASEVLQNYNATKGRFGL